MLRCFILNDTRAEKHHGCETVMRHLLRALAERHVEVLGTLAIGRELDDIQRVECNQADLIIINGEGTLHHGAPYARYLLDCGVAAKQRGQRVWLINSTWQDNPLEMLSQIAQFDGVWLRDQASVTDVRAMVAHAQYAPDLTFAYAHPIDAVQCPSSDTLLLTDSVYSELSDQLAAYAKAQQMQYAPIIRPLPIDTHAIGYDEKKLKKHRLYQWLTYLSFGLYQPRRYYQDLTRAVDQSEHYWSQLQAASAVIAARYHALCFALQLGRPVLALDSNTHKVKRLLGDIGLDPQQRIISLTTLLHTTPADLIARAQWTEQEQQLIKQFNQQAMQRIAYYFDLMCVQENSQ